MAGWRRYDEEFERLFVPVAQRMRYTGRDVETFVWSQRVNGSSDLNRCDPCEDVKELLRPIVQMTDLGRAARHALLNHAEVWRCSKVPPFAVFAPDVMLTGLYGYLRQRSFPLCVLANNEWGLCFLEAQAPAREQCSLNLTPVHRPAVRYQYAGLAKASTQRARPDNDPISLPSSDCQSQPSGCVNSKGALAMPSGTGSNPTLE